MNNPRFHLFLAMVLLATSVKALNIGDRVPDYRSRLWQPGDEFSQNLVQSIAQTSDGYLWIGSQILPARFNGERFDFIRINADTNLDNRINALCTSADGSLWVGTRSGLFRLHQGEWSAQSPCTGRTGNILSLQNSPEGHIWVGTYGGLALWKNEKFSLIDSGGVDFGPVRSLALNSNGDLWVGTLNKLFRLRGQTVVTNLDLSAFKADFIRAIHCSGDGSLWVGSNLGLFHCKDGALRHFSKTNGLPDDIVTAIHEDRGTLWIGTYGGLCRLVDDKFILETTPEGDLFDQILCFYSDRENNFWVGAKNGLYQMSVRQFTTFTTRHGLAHNNVISVFEDREGLWIGTWGGGLHRLRDGAVTIYSAAKTSFMRNDLVLAIAGSREGGLWFGEDYDGGLYRWQNGQFQHYGEEQGIGRGGIRAILESSKGQLLIGTATSGVGILDEGRVSYFKPTGLPSQHIRCLIEARDGSLWIGTEGGLCLWTNDTALSFTTSDGLPDNFIFSLYEDKERNLWIGTAKGLCRIKNEKLKRQNGESEDSNQRSESHASHLSYQSYASLGDDAILEILEDDFENLWLGTRRGVIRVSKSELDLFETGKAAKISFARFGKEDGMASEACVGVAKPSALKSKDGHLWFATTKGVAVTNPKLVIARNEKAPPVVIENVIADKKVQSLKFNVQSQEQRAAETTSNFKPETLNLEPGKGELEFRYAALSYTAPEKNRFKYKLEGVDSEWVEAGARRVAYYNNLQPGDYQFSVIACNSDGIWNSLGSNVKLRLLPHFWQTWWFLGFCGIIAAGAVGGSARYITRRKMQWKLERLEQQHAVERERGRIAQDLHDDLGARLSEILILSNLPSQGEAKTSDLARQLNRVSNAARSLVDNLDAIVWAVNPKNDSFDRLVFYLCEYAPNYLEPASIRCRFDLPQPLPKEPLASGLRHNLFLVVKEALHNTIKHAQATEVGIALRIESSNIVLEVTDNGKGFEPGKSSAMGNGLLNMEDRVKKLGGQCQITSEPGKGTRVELRIPLHR